MTSDITIILSTYNRSKILQQTLEGFSALIHNPPFFNLIVVDNNSSDTTKQIIHEYMNRIPLTYLFEPKPGKNCAINHALSTVSLGDIVVFTDDDVDPHPDWLVQIKEVSDRRPEYMVFGGRILPNWPNQKIPGWAKRPNIQQWGFSVHEYSDHECTYVPPKYPFGANFWVRKKILMGGRRFNETVGPKPKNRIMGSEKSFLEQLQREGFEVIFTPRATVRHQIRPDQLEVSSILRRAYWHGKSVSRLHGLPRERLYRCCYPIWKLLRYASLVKWSSHFLISFLFLDIDVRILKRIDATRWFSYHNESLKFGRELRKAQSVSLHMKTDHDPLEK